MTATAFADMNPHLRAQIDSLKAQRAIDIVEGLPVISNNVFEDLGFSPGEAENLQLRAQLMSMMRAEARAMTQAQAAKRFSVTQPRINDLLRDKIDEFSLDALVSMLAAAG